MTKFHLLNLQVSFYSYIWSLSLTLWPIQIGLQNILTASLLKGKIPTHNECPGYYIESSDGEAPVMLEL